MSNFQMRVFYHKPEKSRMEFGAGAQIISENSCGAFVDFCIKCETFKLQELQMTPYLE